MSFHASSSARPSPSTESAMVGHTPCCLRTGAEPVMTSITCSACGTRPASGAEGAPRRCARGTHADHRTGTRTAARPTAVPRSPHGYAESLPRSRASRARPWRRAAIGSGGEDAMMDHDGGNGQSEFVNTGGAIHTGPPVDDFDDLQGSDERWKPRRKPSIGDSSASSDRSQLAPPPPLPNH